MRVVLRKAGDHRLSTPDDLQVSERSHGVRVRSHGVSGRSLGVRGRSLRGQW